MRLSAVVAAALLAGVELADTPARKTERAAFVRALTEALPVVAFDPASARAHAVIVAALRRAGQSMGAHDAMIAATALGQGAGVLSDHVEHFARVAGLRVVRPDWGALRGARAHRDAARTGGSAPGGASAAGAPRNGPVLPWRG